MSADLKNNTSPVRTEVAGVPLISIITATFNADSSLAKCIDSIRQQSFPHYEHIVVDGASTDHTLAILESFHSPKLQWTSEPDSGIADAMNKGASRAKGEWLLFLHSDDWLHDSQALHRAATYLPNDLDLAFFNTVVVSATNRARIWKVNLGRRWRKMPASHQGMFFRKTEFQRFGGFDTDFAIAMDYELVLRMMRNGVSALACEDTVSAVSETGVSARRDWPSVRRRILEERRIQFSTSKSVAGKSLYSLYWLLYYPFKRTVCRLKGLG